MHSEIKAEVFETEQSQAVRIPAQFRFNTEQVYVEHDPLRGTILLSERPLLCSAEEMRTQQELRAASLQELFAQMDADGGFDFELERDMRPAEERDWLQGL